jgi:hypothetical protein
MARLDQVADVDALFADPTGDCVIVAWDTDMPGAGVQPDGGVGTPPALAAAARNRVFASPCETTIDPRQGSLARGWFVTRFGPLGPVAHDWGVSLFLREPLPDGENPGCAFVTPPG